MNAARSLAVVAAGASLALAATAAANAGETDTGTVRGSMYSADVERTPQGFPILVVPSDTAQPIPLEDYSFMGDPDLNHLLPSTHSGPGLVRPDEQGEYAFTGLPPGEYLVVAYALFAGEYQSPPPEDVQISLHGDASSMRGYRVDLDAGSTATVDFVFAGPSKPEGPSSFRVCITTYDQATLDSRPDRITSVTFDPPRPDIAVTLLDDGCAFLDNVSPGSLTMVVESARGFTTSHTIDIGPGEHGGQINFGIGPPIGDGGINLPNDGYGPTQGATPLPLVLGLGALGAATLASGAMMQRRTRR